MNRTSADEQLMGAQLVPYGEGTVAQAKELERKLLDADIPTALTKPEAKACCGGGGCGCGAKLAVMVREQDVERVAKLLQGDWLAAVEREGLLQGTAAKAFGGAAIEGETLACPACGFAGALINGACADCGLQLE